MADTQKAIQLLPMILAGGIGARLAPISTPDRPKPFLPLASGESLLTTTLRRVSAPFFLSPLLIGRDTDRFALLNHAREAGVSPAAILLEPTPKNTAMAVAIAVAQALSVHGGDSMLAVLPADHLIAPDAVWHNAVTQAASLARQRNKLCLIGVKPQGSDSNYGYMQLNGAGEVTRFIEKPADPAPLLAAGALWNAGQFIGSAKIFAAFFEQYAPDIWLAANRALKQARQEWEFTLLDAAAYQQVGAAPFDRAIVEQAECVAVEYSGDWADLGTVKAWEAATGLAAAHYATLPIRTDRPWGYFELITAQPGRVEKRLVLYPGCRISRQRHHHRGEEWEIIDGTARVDIDDKVNELQKGDKITIPAGSWHRLANSTEQKLIIKEIQSGMPDEADIERADDDYGRHLDSPILQRKYIT